MGESPPPLPHHQLPEQRHGSLLRMGAGIRIGLWTGKSQNPCSKQIMLRCEAEAMPGPWGPEGTIDLGVRICLN